MKKMIMTFLGAGLAALLLASCSSGGASSNTDLQTRPLIKHLSQITREYTSSPI